MKKFINAPETVVEELLEGFALANPSMVQLEKGRIVVNRKIDEADRVALVSIGGSGHEPCAIGYVGEALLDAFVAGDIFVAPPVEPTVAAIARVDRGRGVLLVGHGASLLGVSRRRRCRSSSSAMCVLPRPTARWPGLAPPARPEPGPWNRRRGGHPRAGQVLDVTC